MFPKAELPQAQIQQPQGPDAQALRLQQTMKEASAAVDAIKKEKVEKDKQKAEVREFYSSIDGCRYVFKDGTDCHFHGGVYATSKPSEIEQLEELLSLPGQHLIVAEPVAVRKRDLQILQEVGASGNGGIVQGMVHTGNIMPR